MKLKSRNRGSKSDKIFEIWQSEKMYNGQDAVMFVLRDVSHAVRNESVKADF